MATKGGPNIVRDGLILCLDAANPSSYPGSGSTWYDLSGNSNHTTIVKGEFVSSGYFQSIGDNPGQLNFITPNSTSISNALTVITGGWTIEEIILIDDTTYPESTAGTTCGYGIYSAGNKGFDWGHGTNTNNSLNMTVNDGVNLIRQDIYLNTAQSQYDKWIHRTFVYDRINKKVNLYYDAVFQNSLDISTITGSIFFNYEISWGSLYGWQHDGFRSGMKIYNKILSEADILQNFNATKSRYGL